MFRAVFVYAISTAIITMSFACPALQAAETIPAELRDVGITEKLGRSVQLDQFKFRDEAGRAVKLSSYFTGGRPVVLNLLYYGCPNLCTFVLNGLVDSLKKLDWVPGKQFEVVTVSIDPRDTPELATQKKAAYLASYGHPEAAAGWHFLTAAADQSRGLADQVGFGYRYDAKEGQYAHGAAIFILTPEGRISRYLYGIEFAPKDLKLALLEASNGKIGNVIERFLLFCYRYNPQTRKYSVTLTRVMQAGSFGTMIAFGGFLTVFWRRQRRREPDSHVL